MRRTMPARCSTSSGGPIIAPARRRSPRKSPRSSAAPRRSDSGPRARTLHITLTEIHMAATATSVQVGKVVQVIGPVLDIEFEADHLPELYNAIEIKGMASEGFPI